MDTVSFSPCQHLKSFSRVDWFCKPSLYYKLSNVISEYVCKADKDFDSHTLIALNNAGFESAYLSNINRHAIP